MNTFFRVAAGVCFLELTLVGFLCAQRGRRRRSRSAQRAPHADGEGHGGCTGTDDFFEKLDAEFELAAEVRIPQFEHLHDYMTVYERK